MRASIIAIALIAASGMAYAQSGTSTPSTPSPGAATTPQPGVTPQPGLPSTSSPPSATNTPSPGALNPSTTTAAEAAARSKIEAAGYSGVKGLTMAPNGTWRGIGMRNNVEVAVSIDSSGQVMAQQ
jgi:hypothetical protein